MFLQVTFQNASKEFSIRWAKVPDAVKATYKKKAQLINADPAQAVKKSTVQKVSA